MVVLLVCRISAQGWRDKTRGRIKDYVEGRTTGKAFHYMVELTDDRLPTMRSDLQRKFAKATPTVIRCMEQEYDAGIPDKASAVIFPSGIDIEDELE